MFILNVWRCQKFVSGCVWSQDWDNGHLLNSLPLCHRTLWSHNRDITAFSDLLSEMAKNCTASSFLLETKIFFHKTLKQRQCSLLHIVQDSKLSWRDEQNSSKRCFVIWCLDAEGEGCHITSHFPAGQIKSLNDHLCPV